MTPLKEADLPVHADRPPLSLKCTSLMRLCLFGRFYKLFGNFAAPSDRWTAGVTTLHLTFSMLTHTEPTPIRDLSSVCHCF